MNNKLLKIAVLAVFFILLSEKISLLNISVALVLAFGVTSLMNSPVNLSKYISGKLGFKWIVYGVILFFEVIKANIQVAIITLSPKMDVEPVVVSYESQLNDEWLLIILANSITLTPGTMTIDIEGSKLLIHCLNHAYSESLKDMLLEKMLCEIEGGLYE